jgi:restriction endonuclease S subunit
MARSTASWREVGFDEAFQRLKLKAFEIPTKDYQVAGTYPIIDQGDGAVAGYIDRENPISDVPFIVFGDHTTIVKYVDQRCFIGSQGVVPLKARECYDPYFLYLMLGRTRIPALGYSRHFRELENKTFPLPPLAEQRKIAEILRTWDEAIETAEAELKAKQERKRGLMKKLLMPSVEGAGAVSKAKNNTNWLESRVGEVAELKNGYAFKSEQYDTSGPYRVITISNVQDGRLDTAGCKYIKRIPDDFKQYQLLDVGDILISMTGNVGRICKVSETGLLLNQRVGRIIPKNIDDEFFYYVLASESFRDRMVELAQGGAQPNLSVGDIQDYIFAYPASSETQRKIAEILLSADGDTELINKRIASLRTQKLGLMQKLLTGEVRVTA